MITPQIESKRDNANLITFHLIWWSEDLMEYSVENISAGAPPRFALTSGQWMEKLESFHPKKQNRKLCWPPFLVWVLSLYNSVFEKTSVRDTCLVSFFSLNYLLFPIDRKKWTSDWWTVALALSVELRRIDTRRTDWCKSLEQKENFWIGLDHWAKVVQMWSRSSKYKMEALKT